MAPWHGDRILFWNFSEMAYRVQLPHYTDLSKIHTVSATQRCFHTYFQCGCLLDDGPCKTQITATFAKKQSIAIFEIWSERIHKYWLTRITSHPDGTVAHEMTSPTFCLTGWNALVWFWHLSTWHHAWMPPFLSSEQTPLLSTGPMRRGPCLMGWE